jgi:lipoprotein-releasing system ATP-binding protein
MSNIELRNVSKVYPDAGHELKVLDSVSYIFPQSGTVGIVGRSGVGKSTLLHLLGGLDIPSEGEVFFGDKNLASLTPDQLSTFRGEKIGFVFQFHHLLSDFTAAENVGMPLLIRGFSKERVKSSAEEILTRVGLGHRLGHLPGQLSGGEQQRVAIARALVAKPALLLADEPTGSLDLATALEIRAILLDIVREYQMLMVVVTHSEEFANDLDIRLEMFPGGKLSEHRV